MVTTTIQQSKAESSVQKASPNQKIEISEQPKRGSLSQRLLAIKVSNENRFDFVVEASQEIAESFNAAFAMVEFKDGGQTIAREYRKADMSTDELVNAASMLSIESQMDGSSRGKLVEGQDNFMMMSCPFISSNGNDTKGSLTIYVQVADKELGQKLLNSFETTIKWLLAAVEEFESISEAPAEKTISHGPALDAIGRSGQYENLTHLCMALANNYCEKLGCEKAAISLVKKDEPKLKLFAISGMESFKENSPPIIQLLQVQEECFDFGNRICVQLDETLVASDRKFLIHQQWHKQSAGACVVSIPIRNNDEMVGVLSLQRRGDLPFSNEELDRIDHSVNNFTPAILLMRRAERSLRRHFLEDFLQTPSQKFKKSTAAIVALVALAFIIFGWMPYRPTVPCVIEPGQVSRLVAPFDGVLQAVEFVPGDRVEAGQTVLKFDTRSLELVRDGLLAQIKSKSIFRDQAIQQRQTADAKILDAEVEVLEAQLQAAIDKIARANMTSNVSGHLVRGDLRQDVGQTIVRGTALAEIAPCEGMRIRLHIPESRATHIDVGYTGYFAADSNPGDKRTFKIVSITPSTEIIDGANVVVAEAEVVGDCKWMRSGMKGYAQIDAGWSPVFWVIGHRFWNSLRLGFWV